MSDIVINAEKLGKCYHIYNHPVDRLKQSLWRHKKKFYREFWALRDVCLQVKRGETLGIIGSNGSGKTTLLQMICGTLWPTVGHVSVNGRIAALLELGAGFNPEFTGRENVYMNAAVMGLCREEIDSRYDDIVKFADIGQFMEQPVKVYSSGMYLRLAFATAVHVSPEILVVDEALAVGDARFQQKCIVKIKEFCEKGTVLFVTHNSSIVTELCTRALWIEKGRVQMDDKPKLVVEKYLQFMYEGKNALLTKPEAKIKKNKDTRVDTSEFVLVNEKIRQFGNRKAVIEGVRIVSGNQKNTIVYTERPCEISVLLHSHEMLQQPIVGFIIKDKLGRELIGDNTILLNGDLPPFEKNQNYMVTFLLTPWPNLLEDDYSLTVAVGNGKKHNHVQCHYLHDILIFRSIPVRKPPTLISVPNTHVSYMQI